MSRASNLDPYGHSEVEVWKIAEQRNFISKLNDFKRYYISSGALNPPDRPLHITKDCYQNDNVFQRIFNSYSLAKFLIKMEIHSLRYSKSIFQYRKEIFSSKFRKFSIFNNYLSDIAIRMSYYSHKIKTYSDSNSIILEIGAGYGALALYSKGNFSKYIIVDLPENLFLAYEFLTNANLNCGTILDLHNKNVDVILINGDDLKAVQEVDVVVNTMSFQHMKIENLEYYFDQIDRIGPKFIYLVNRIIKRDISDVEIQNYPIPKKYHSISSNFIYSEHYLEIVLENQS